MWVKKNEKVTQGLEKNSCSEKTLPFQVRQPLRPRAHLANWWRMNPAQSQSAKTGRDSCFSNQRERENRILFSYKKRWNCDTCYNRDEPWWHCAKWNKPDTKEWILYDFTYMRYSSRFIETERTIAVVSIESRGKRELSLKGYNFQFGSWKFPGGG